MIPPVRDGAHLVPGTSSALVRAIEAAAARWGGGALKLYQGAYVDLVLAAESPASTVTLVAGAHDPDFPYLGTPAWDNCLLLVGEEGFSFTATGAEAGRSLAIRFDLQAETAAGTITFRGQMARAGDGPSVTIELEIPVEVRRFPERRLGEAYNVLGVEGLVGMRWNPWSLVANGGRLRIDGREVVLSAIRGSAERGVLDNLCAPELAIRYDYLAVARPGAGGYGLISFRSHALFPDGVVGRVLDEYLVRTASATLTIDDAGLVEGNPREVRLVGPTDEAALVFTTTVDLGLATLDRQMVRTTDGEGRAVYGLREIFHARERAARPLPERRTWVALGAAVAALVAVVVAVVLTFALR